MDASHFFSVSHAVPINVECLPEGYPLPNAEQLEAEIPEPFRIANDVAQLDVAALRPLRGLADTAPELVDFLNLQARKISLIMGYVLALQDDPGLRRQTESFGASQLCYLDPQPLPTGQRLRLKIFLPQEAAAVYCYGEVAAAEASAQGYRISVHYRCLREQDQDALVRASLHIQRLQLKNRAASRHHPSN